MSRKPKGLRPETRKALATPGVNCLLDFDVIQHALGSSLSEDDQANIEFAVFHAVRAEGRKIDVAPKEIIQFLSDLAANAALVAESLAPTKGNYRGKQLKRHLRITIERYNPKLDTVDMASDLRSLAKEAKAEANRCRLRGARKGRPATNENWMRLIQFLADMFERIHEATDRKASISFSTGRPTGLFYQFVLAVFSGISDQIRPSDSAIAHQIKPALLARRQNGTAV